MDTLFKLILLLAGVALVHCDDPIVLIQNGKLLGRNNGRYLSFESIPYAQPPTGANRFEPPKPYTDMWLGVRDATNPPENCIQWATIYPAADKLMGVEDCLTVSVYTPDIEYTVDYPVLVLVHAGVFTFGGSSWHGHEYVMKSGNAVVVKINYRLGALGFLSTEDDVISGNFGLKDQLLALEWIKTNIAAFGGNPLNITVLGFGAGGASVHLQMMNKRLEKLASTAISFSGNAFNPSVITRNASEKAAHLAEYLGCPTDNSSVIKSCLQEKDAEDLARAIPHFYQFGSNPFVIFGPVIESKDVEDPFLSEELEDIIKAGKSAEIPWLASCDKDEGAFNAAELLQKFGDVEIIEDLNERWKIMAPVIFFFNNTHQPEQFEAYSEELRKKYMGDKRFSAENYRLLQKMYTDVLFLHGIEKALKLHKQYTRSPVYAYGYDNPSPTGFGQMLSHRNDIDFGTAHGDDFFLMFKSPPRRNALLSLSDHILSQTFIKMIVNFSATGNLEFGSLCKFVPNNSTTNNLWIAHITKDYCEVVNVETIL